MSKFLIINADDFGYNKQQTTAVSELMSEGLITSTSLMAVADDAHTAVALARDGGFSVGVHLTINSDSAQNPWHSLSNRPSMSNSEGMFAWYSDFSLIGRG